MNYPANPLLFLNVMPVAGSPAVIWNTPGEPSFCEAGIIKSVCFSNDFEGILGNLIQSRSPPMCCWSTTQAAQRRPCTHTDLLGSGNLQKYLFSNDSEAFLANGFREPTPKMMRWAPLRQHSGVSRKTFVSLCFPMLLRMRQ